VNYLNVVKYNRCELGQISSTSYKTLVSIPAADYGDDVCGLLGQRHYHYQYTLEHTSVLGAQLVTSNAVTAIRHFLSNL